MVKYEGDILSNSRTKNVAQNAWWALITQAVTIVLSFVSRTVFIYVLGVEYLGINGLFTNILMLLSFAELGIGNAIIYSMYKPLASKDKEKIKALMDLYAKAYKIIGMSVLVIGLSIIPFIDFIIKETPDIRENIILLYLLFLINTTVSYFFVYKKSIIMADQKNYIVSIYQQVFQVIQVLFQIIFLVLTQEYILFLIIQILCTILNNIVTARKADKMYPYLKGKTKKQLDKDEKTSILKNVKALFLYKLASVVLSGTDNIIISAMIGVAAVGLSSNYILIIAAFTAISSQIMNAFTASIGNLNAIGEEANKERVFDRMFLISSWLHGFFSIGLYIFLNPFIELWIGNEYILGQSIVFAMVLHFYIISMHAPAYTYRTTMGLFVQGRWAPLLAAIINIILSLWLGKTMGLFGIFISTSIARFFTIGIVDPILIYRNGFNKSPMGYYRNYSLLTLLFLIIHFIINIILSFVSITGIFGFVIQVAIVTFVFNLIMAIVLWNTDSFRAIRKSLMGIVRN